MPLPRPDWRTLQTWYGGKNAVAERSVLLAEMEQNNNEHRTKRVEHGIAMVRSNMTGRIKSVVRDLIRRLELIARCVESPTT
jgi:hypothetical protein